MKLKAGKFVKWSASRGEARGRVVSVHTAKVPGVIIAMTASTESPAARVQLYAKSGDGWEPTSVYVAHAVSALSEIDDLPEPATEALTVIGGSFDDLRQKVEAAINENLVTDEGTSVYVHDIGPTWAVYRVDWAGELMMVDYGIDADGVVSLGEPFAVTKMTTYVADEEVVTESVERIHGRLLGALGTDAAGGRVFEVQIIAYGDSLNNVRYPESVMRAAVPLYEGTKAYDHHRSQPELVSSTVVGLIGHYENVRATDTGLVAELHLLPSATHAAEALDRTLSNQAKGMRPLVGISHDAYTVSRVISAEGRQLRELTAVTSVNSSDVVADPAAGGEAMRMVASRDPLQKGTTMTLLELLEALRLAESAQRPALLAQHAAVLEAAGVTPEAAIRHVESLASSATNTTTPGAGERTVEAATFTKASTIGRVVVETTLRNLQLEHMTEAILGELPEQFTEAELNAKAASAKRMYEHAQAQRREIAGLAPSVEHLDVTQDELDKKRAALDAMVAGAPGGFRSLKEAYTEWTGRRERFGDTEDFNRQVLRESTTMVRHGERVRFDSQYRDTESVISTTFAYALGDSITRRAVAVYNQPSLQAWRSIVSNVYNLRDFRTQRIERIGGYGTLPTVPEGAPYQPLTTPTDQEVTYAPAKKGGTEKLTLEAIANDDLRQLQDIPRKLGLAAAQTLFRFVMDFLDTNPTVYDAVALFAVGHANTDTNALSGGNLSIARKKMRKQTAYGDTSNVLSIVPRTLIVVSDLEELAFELCTSNNAMPSVAPVGAATNIPNLHQGMTPLTVDYWTSTTKWFTVADPNMVPTIEIGFYQGREEPELFVQSDPTVGSMFDTDSVLYKVRHVYGGAVLDYRGFYRGNT